MKIKSTKKWPWSSEQFKIMDPDPKPNNLVPYININELTKYKKVALQVDGGGILGVLPAYVLLNSVIKSNEEYLNECPTLSPLSFNTIVDDYYGTSTGSIITAGIYRKLPVGKIFRFYVELGPKIFHERNIFGKIFRKSLYKSDELEKQVHKIFGDITFQEAYDENENTTLNIATVDRFKRKTIICNYKNTPDFPIYRAIMMSTAAPAYFPHYRYKDSVYLDGGTGTYNSLLEKASWKYVTSDTLSRECYIISLGCGKSGSNIISPTKKQIKEAMKEGKIKSLLFTALFGRKESTDKQVSKFTEYKKKIDLKGIRWNPILPGDLDKMAETDNINELISYLEV